MECLFENLIVTSLVGSQSQLSFEPIKHYLSKIILSESSLLNLVVFGHSTCSHWHFY